ncbi:MAG: transcriptional repressor [Candidatus Bathyarchaeia archaeon]|nr:transcriptional repressor [Candidatus Bathyarchaeota archaeon]
MNKIWPSTPLTLFIIETLEKKKSMIDKDELLKEVKEKYGEISFKELNNALLKLEILGLIKVSRLMKGKRVVELAKTS